MKLKGKVAIVTGGGQGIGEGIVQCLAEEGADIAIIDINADTATKVAADVKSMGRKSLAVEADLTDNNRVEKAVRDTLDFFGKIDILVNNAGGYPMDTLEGATGLRIIDRTGEEWDRLYELNLKTQVLMCRAAVPHMMKQKSGKIVNISSISAVTPSAQLICYAVAKAGVVHYSRTLARDLAGDNINVNCICPGVLYTPLWEKGAAALGQFNPQTAGMKPREFFDTVLVPQVPLRREQTPEDIGRAVVFFVSEEARNITGQTLDIDGGMAFV